MSSDPFGFSRATATRKSESPTSTILPSGWSAAPNAPSSSPPKLIDALAARPERGVEVAVGAQPGDAEPARRGAEAGDHDPPVGLHEHGLRLVVAAEADPLLAVAGEARVEVTRGHVLTLLGLRPAPLGRDVRSPSPGPHAAPSLEPCPPRAPCSSSPWPPCALAGCGDDGPRTSQTRDVAAFTRIENRSSVDVRLRVGEPQRVQVFAGEKVIDDVSTEVRDGTLEVDFDHSGWGGDDVEVEATVPELTGIEVLGLRRPRRRRHRRGRSSSCSRTARADIALAGTAGRLLVTLDGSGDADLADLAARDARVDVSGSGDLDVRARASGWTSRSTARATSATSASPR